MDRPKDYNDAVQAFPDGFRPFDAIDAPCLLSVEVQAFAYHYNLSDEVIAVLVAEDVCEMRDVRLADPDGNHEQKDYYKESVNDRVLNRKQKMLVRMAFRRMLSPNPYTAVVASSVVAPPVVASAPVASAPINASSSSSAPSSSSAASSSSGRPVADGTSSSSPSLPKGKSSSSSSKGKATSKRGASVAFSSSEVSETDQDDDGDDDDDGDGDDAADSADGAGSSRRSSRVPDDVSTLVNELGDEVFLDLLFVVMTFIDD